MPFYALPKWSRMLGLIAVCALTTGLLLTPGVLAEPVLFDRGDVQKQTQDESEKEPVAKVKREEKAMKVFYLEIVTKEVDAVCETYAAIHDVKFGNPDPGLGNARTASMPGGGMVGIRGPMRDTETPIVRPYWLVQDIKTAVVEAEKNGGKLAHPPMEIPGHGTFAIYIQGGIEHGLWQK